ncbi:MAG: hypothetical protein ACE5HN_03495 [Nitrospiria bacterium]
MIIEFIAKLPFVVSPSMRWPFILSLSKETASILRTGLSNHERPFVGQARNRDNNMPERLSRMIKRWRRVRIKYYLILSIVLFSALLLANLLFLRRFF